MAVKIKEDRFVATIINQAALYHGELENLRWGQCFSMALDAIDSEVGNQIVGTPHDCFYSDELIPAFIAKAKDLYYSRPTHDA